MNKIDEITLRVGCELWGEFHPRVTDYNEVKQLTRFANALLAELSKDAEPVAFTNSCELEYLDFKRADGGLVIGAMWKEWDEDADIPLFTSPPNTADVERRVAEACEQGKRDAVPEDIRKDAESWRAYKKRKDEVIAAGMGKKILRDAAAPKQEKGS